MEIIVVKNYKELSKLSAEVIAEVIKNKPDAVLGLATGSTPIGCYENLIEMYRNGELSFEQVRTVNLDEYVGLDKNHPQSYAYFMRDKLFNKIDIKPENTHIPNGCAEDLVDSCDRYNHVLSVLHRDVQLLGLGSNGHIGFNEPGTPFCALTHITDLAESTIKDNARLFNNVDEVPTQALTMGVKDILRADKIIILASGKNKAEAVKAMVKGPITNQCPASALQEHENCIVILDEDATSLL